MSAFRAIVADPPWSFRDKLPGRSRGAEKNYSVMRQLDIESYFRLFESDISPDAHLFLWRVASQVEEAYRVVRAWGFVPKTELVWRKLTPTGKIHFGMGRTLRSSHEVCIVATRGKPTPKSKSVRTIFDAPVGRHSEKPEAFFALVEQLTDGPYLELFARRKRPGWVCVGDEVG
jgi:N6-adenosine-specific RNA methylase IME4